MAKFQKGKIYKVCNTIDDDIYIGSTIETLGRRMTKHRYNAKQGNDKTLLQLQEKGVENLYIELIEEYPCSNKQELRAREGYWQRQLNNINKRIEDRTSKEWYQDVKHDEEFKQKRQEYRDAHKEQILHNEKIYRQENKDKIKEWRQSEHGKTCLKNWREKNKEHVQEINRRSKSQIIPCDKCGCEMQRGSLHKHKQTKKCKNYQPEPET